ncbi:MAG: hypothetical protein AAGC83_11955 [Pseudomonadota bacterium]
MSRDHAIAKTWITLFDELARWEDLGLKARLWWRDDDAQKPTSALDRLIELSDLHQVPVLLAIIPHGTEPDLAAYVTTSSAPLWVAQHGISHANNAPADTKKTELHDSMLANPAFAATIKSEYDRLADQFGAKLLPVMVAPWNRIGPKIAGSLKGWGFDGLSTDGPPEPAAHGLVQVNTHIDLVNWRADAAFIGADRAVSAMADNLSQRRQAPGRQSEVTGILTHHLVHDRALWAFLGHLFGLTATHPAIEWVSPHHLFRPA